MRIHLSNRVMLTQCVILFALFDGDPSQWASYLQSDGSAPQRKDDLPFVHWVLEQHRNDETFLRDLRILMLESSGRSH